MVDHLRPFSDFVIFAHFNSEMMESENGLKWSAISSFGPKIKYRKKCTYCHHNLPIIAPKYDTGEDEKDKELYLLRFAWLIIYFATVVLSLYVVA